jgi:RNA polymerase sigma-32 factor
MTTSISTFRPQLPIQTLAAPISNIEAYISFANSVPMLTLEEEQSLTARLQTHNDMDAAQRLILSHLRFVIKIARGFAGYGLQMADLIQEGNVGLMKAVKRFDPKHGVRLVTFAVHWVKAEMHEFIIKNWRIVKIATTKAQRKLFFNLRNSKKRLGWFKKSEIKDLAETLNVRTKDVIEMERRMNNFDMAFDAPETADDTPAFHPAQFLMADSQSPEDAVVQDADTQRTLGQLHSALEGLNDRARSIIQRRWFDDNKATLHDLAAEYNVSAERIRQIEAQAMKQLRAEISA